MPVEEKAMPFNEKFLSAAEVEDSACPSWGGWKVWFAVATAEFAVIIILAVGMAHFALHEERGQNSTGLPDRGMLTSLQRINQTLEDATKRLEACQSNTVCVQGLPWNNCYGVDWEGGFSFILWKNQDSTQCSD